MRQAPLGPILACSFSAAAAPGLVVFVHDQSSDQILRMQDLNHDGDAHDPGEVSVFFDAQPPGTGVQNAQGLVATDAHTLLATDNFEPDNIVLLRDADRDGDAFGPGESTVWFDGLLPGGLTITNPAELRPRPDGSFFLLDNNTLDVTRPEAVYLVDDLDADGDVNDPGEVTLFFELSPVGLSSTSTLDVVQDAAGRVYTLDFTDPLQIESIDVIDPAGLALTEWLNSADLFMLRNLVLGSTYELAWLPETDEILFGALTVGGDQHVCAARDANGSGRIDAPSEVRVLWSESGHADGFNTGSPRDFHVASGGRVLWPDALRDRVMLLQDLNGDGDFQDAGETAVYFDAAVAAANGLPTLTLPLSIAAAEPCPADLAEPFGVLNFFDVSAYLSAYNAQDASADLADPFGVFNFFDVAAFLAFYNAGCP